MLVFAHLRKCAGTSVDIAAEQAGTVLPPGHLNGHLPNEQGHALAGMSGMSTSELGDLLRPLVASGVQMLAIEWDFPRIEKFPADLDLNFFTIFRDPVDRLISNYAFDVLFAGIPMTSLWEWMERDDIWAQPNYYTRFYSGLRPTDAVARSDVDYVVDVLTSRFKMAFFGDDLQRFLARDVGLPITSLGRLNQTSGWPNFWKRRSLRVSFSDRRRLRAMNGLDYELCDRLRRWRSARPRARRGYAK
jgi:hypothetical protein